MKVKFLVLALVVLITLQGCDWVKRQLGMPTSDDIEKKRIEMIEAAKAQRIADSLNALRADSLKRAEQQKNIPYINGLDKRFYLILGSFKKDFNAELMYENLKKEGYSAVRIPLKNGFDMVSAFGTDSYAEALAELNKISMNDLCPYDVWIYDVSQNLHE